FNGRVKHAITEIKSDVNSTIWAVTFDPSGKQVAYGADDGSVWLWDVEKPYARRLGSHASQERFNYVRLVAFLGPDRLISVARAGQVLEWDVSAEKPTPRLLLQFDHPKVFHAVLSPDHKWLGVLVGTRTLEEGAIARRVEVRSLDGQHKEVFDLPLGH